MGKRFSVSAAILPTIVKRCPASMGGFPVYRRFLVLLVGLAHQNAAELTEDIAKQPGLLPPESDVKAAGRRLAAIQMLDNKSPAADGKPRALDQAVEQVTREVVSQDRKAT